MPLPKPPFSKKKVKFVFWGWIWIGVIILAILIEVITDQLVSIWFVPASIVAIILDFCSVDIVWQVLVFLLLSAVGIAAGYFLFVLIAGGVAV